MAYIENYKVNRHENQTMLILNKINMASHYDFAMIDVRPNEAHKIKFIYITIRIYN